MVRIVIKSSKSTEGIIIPEEVYKAIPDFHKRDLKAAIKAGAEVIHPAAKVYMPEICPICGSPKQLSADNCSSCEESIAGMLYT